MKRVLLPLLLIIGKDVFAQQSDFIVLKKPNNRTLKTYYPGIFLSAVTINGFTINGFITDIRNDSIIIQQKETRLVKTEFGTRVDTLVYTIGILYQQIMRFNYTGQYVGGRRKGFTQVTIPRLLKIGGTGFIVLELVNTAYRGESLTANNKLAALGIAAVAAAAGFVWQKINDNAKNVGGKYKVVYIKVKK